MLHTFHVVRLDSGEVLALSARDPHLGCTVPYRPSLIYNGREGWFHNPCHREIYDLAGYRVFGPQPRGLDRFHVEVVAGRVTVDLSRLQPGPTTIPLGYELQTGGVYGPNSAPLASLPRRGLQRTSVATQRRKLARPRAARPGPRWQTFNPTVVG